MGDDVVEGEDVEVPAAKLIDEDKLEDVAGRAPRDDEGQPRP